jgi:transcriptional regulator with XRE-family HTH domain
MRVTQADVAARAGIDRTTVNKILNRRPEYQANRETVAKVVKAAEALGYDISRLRRDPERRMAARTGVDLSVDLELRFKDGRLHDSGSARLSDLSLSGALLGDMQTRTKMIPAEPFTARLTFRRGALKGITMDAEFVRFAGNGEMYFGVRFERLSRNIKKALSIYLESR